MSEVHKVLKFIFAYPFPSKDARSVALACSWSYALWLIDDEAQRSEPPTAPHIHS